MPARTRAHREKTLAKDGLTRTERLAFERMTSLAHALDHEDVYPYQDLPDQIPEAWDTLERDIDVDEPRDKVTLYLDRSVAKFFRAQGRGYQDRINRILATYAQMKIAGVNKSNALWRKERERVARERQAREALAAEAEAEARTAGE